MSALEANETRLFQDLSEAQSTEDDPNLKYLVGTTFATLQKGENTLSVLSSYAHWCFIRLSCKRHVWLVLVSPVLREHVKLTEEVVNRPTRKYASVLPEAKDAIKRREAAADKLASSQVRNSCSHFPANKLKIPNRIPIIFGSTLNCVEYLFYTICS